MKMDNAFLHVDRSVKRVGVAAYEFSNETAILQNESPSRMFLLALSKTNNAIFLHTENRAWFVPKQGPFYRIDHHRCGNWKIHKFVDE